MEVGNFFKWLLWDESFADFAGFYDDYLTCDVSVDNKRPVWFKWRKQEPTELRRKAVIPQLPPTSLRCNKSIMPRARAHLPAGMRKREVIPDA